MIAVSAIALSGCVSATADMKADDVGGSPQIETAQSAQESTVDGDVPEGYRDPMVTAVNGGNGASAAPHAESASPSPTPDLASAIMQPAQVNANSMSIYASPGAAAASPPGESGAAANPGGITNLYQTNPADAAIPDTTGSIPTGGQSDEEASLVPDRVPLPKSGRLALAPESSGTAAEEALAARMADAPVEQQSGQSGSAPTNDLGKTLTLAALFAAKRNTSNQNEGRNTSASPRKQPILNRETAAAYQSASLGTPPLPGIAATVSPNDHSEYEEETPEGEDNNGVTEVASLAGLARLSPSGLWLQTDKVKTGCFRPELVSVLKEIEHHYGKPVIVTSGVRNIRPGRAKQSLHTRCEAADIQIAGVTRWELAEYLRSMPGRGGVGTYCHTESVHIDIGPERDWNWQCRTKRK